MKTKHIVATAIVGTALYLWYRSKKNQEPLKPKFNLFGGADMCAIRSLNLRNATNDDQKIIDACIKSFGNLTTEQQNNIKLIIKAFKKLGDCDNAKLAYILATAWHESRFKPLREGFAKNDAAARLHVAKKDYGKVINGHVYYGRGFSQLTWDHRYKEFGKILGIDLYNNPDLAMIPEYAAEILVIGMIEGKFTYKKLETYITATAWDFYNARRTVNGTDKATQIKGYAEKIINA